MQEIKLCILVAKDVLVRHKRDDDLCASTNVLQSTKRTSS
jgi:hypothetical protein